MESKPMELPKEWEAKIQKDACEVANIGDGGEVSSFRNGMYSGYRSGALAYAPWLYTCQTNYAALKPKVDRYDELYRLCFSNLAKLRARCQDNERMVSMGDNIRAIIEETTNSMLAMGPFLVQSNEALSGEGERSSMVTGAEALMNPPQDSAAY